MLGINAIIAMENTRRTLGCVVLFNCFCHVLGQTTSCSYNSARRLFHTQGRLGAGGTHEACSHIITSARSTYLSLTLMYLACLAPVENG